MKMHTIIISELNSKTHLLLMIKDISVFVILLYYHVVSNQTMLMYRSCYSKVVKPPFWILINHHSKSDRSRDLVVITLKTDFPN